MTWPRARTARRAILVRAVSSGLGVALSVAGGRALAQTPAPDIIIPVTPPARVRSQRAVQPLPAGLQFRLQRAVDLRVSGLPDRARDTLQVLLKEAPHHPQLVSELARAQLARQDWAAVERLGTAERAAARDSSLLGEELATALERLGKPRDALKVAVEAWTVNPSDGAWAPAVVFRLAPADPKGALATLLAAAEPRPWRTDLTLGLAHLLAMSGRPGDAVKALADAERRSGRGGLRAMFADESLRSGQPADTTAAIAALTDLAADAARRPEERQAAARRAWLVVLASGRDAEWAPKLAQALHDVPAERWGPDLLLSLVRSLQNSGRSAEARALLAASPALEQRMPELALERALGLAREGPPARALPLLDSLARDWPQARFPLAEVQFFAGELDSAHANYDRVAAVPEDPDAAAALDRMYLLEEAPASPVRALLAQIAYERWRGAPAAATVLADSAWRMQQPHGDYAARIGLELASLRMAAGDARGALVPLLVVCDSLAEDRLAPTARQRAGEAYAALGDAKNSLAQYEECLARYPRAWNSAEVRRRVEKLRKERL